MISKENEVRAAHKWLGEQTPGYNTDAVRVVHGLLDTIERLTVVGADDDDDIAEALSDAADWLDATPLVRVLLAEDGWTIETDVGTPVGTLTNDTFGEALAGARNMIDRLCDTLSDASDTIRRLRRAVEAAHKASA